MAYWENTTYLKEVDPRRVMDVLESSFAREGMKRIAAPMQRERLAYEPMQYAPALENDLWGVAVFPGAAGWTVVKTAPLELLGERAPGAARARLSDVCRQLSASAFQVNVYDGSATLLCEVAEDGAMLLSGYGGAGDPMQWHGETLSEEFIQPEFRLLPYQDIVGEGAYGDGFAQALSTAFGGKNSEHCDNATSVGALITHIHPRIDGGEIRYFHWDGNSRLLVPPCSWDEWRRRKQ